MWHFWSLWQSNLHKTWPTAKLSSDGWKQSFRRWDRWVTTRWKSKGWSYFQYWSLQEALYSSSLRFLRMIWEYPKISQLFFYWRESNPKNSYRNWAWVYAVIFHQFSAVRCPDTFRLWCWLHLSMKCVLPAWPTPVSWLTRGFKFETSLHS